MSHASDRSSRRERGSNLPLLPAFSILIVCVLSALCWILSVSWGTYPSLLTNLTWVKGEAQEQLRSRVLAKFPIGSPDSNLIRELEIEGFTIENQGFTIRQFKASVHPSGLSCSVKAIVFWRSSSEGKIETVETDVDSICL
jgi:hypothetical protein